MGSVETNSTSVVKSLMWGTRAKLHIVGIEDVVGVVEIEDLLHARTADDHRIGPITTANFPKLISYAMHLTRKLGMEGRKIGTGVLKKRQAHTCHCHPSCRDRYKVYPSPMTQVGIQTLH